jgi:hypothetical protein
VILGHGKDGQMEMTDDATMSVITASKIASF